MRRVRVRKALMTGSVAAVVAALLFGGFAASRTLSNDAAPIPPADEIDFPNLTTTFVSPRNGFSIKHPDGATFTPAMQWGADVVETGLGAVFRGASIDIPAECSGAELETCAPGVSTTDEWVDDYILQGGCGAPRSEQAEISIDGQSGRIAECPNRIKATVFAGGRLYLFTLLHTRSDARAVFETFVATIDLSPKTAVDFPAMRTTFVSPNYGYSFKYYDRVGVRPAKAMKTWDPVNQPLANSDAIDDWFDWVETGLGVNFESASSEIPDGVSIDEWVDEHVTSRAAGGCGVHRSQQAEIIIDGQPGRIAECPKQIEATVVAGDRLYLFVMSINDFDRSVARAWFDAWVATIDLTPETAAVP